MPDRSQLGLVCIAWETVQDRVYSVLRDRLMRGGFEPGQKLKIAELATALGTSAKPIREALNRLAAERAIETKPNHNIHNPTQTKKTHQNQKKAHNTNEGL